MSYKKHFDREIRSFPEVIDTVQMMQMCRIGKNTVYKWLNSGKINYERLFSIYRIERDSVLRYMYQLRNLQYQDEIYVRNLKKLYEEEMKAQPDVLTNLEISFLTGYSKSCINDWIMYGKLQSLSPAKKNFVPKKYLIAFMVSKHAVTNPMKSDRHKELLEKFESEVLQND